MNRQTNRNLPGNTGSANRWPTFAICLALALAVWIVFGQTRHFEFVNFDDNRYVYENPMVERGLTLAGIGWALTYGGIGHWHPLTWFSHMLDCQLYGLNAGCHHLTNVLLHAATAILLFLVLRNMTGALWRSAFVAAVFAIHPLRVESVAWVAERKDVLSGFFFMLTLWAYVRYVRKHGAERQGAFSFLRFRLYWLVLLFFTLGLLSKSTLVTLPFVLLLLDYWPLGRFAIDDLRFTNSRSLPSLVTRHSSLLWEKIPFLVLSAASCAATGLVAEKVLPEDQVSFTLRLENALTSYVAYLGQMLYPGKLAIPYLYPANGFSLAEVVLALALLVAISVVAIVWWRKHPYVAVGWLWYLGMLVPVIGLVQISYYACADRYTYLPSIGLYIAVAWGAVELCGAWRYRRAALGIAATAILAGLLAAARAQTGYWKDSVSLWTHTLACTPENYIAHNDLGLALAERGEWTEAMQHYEQALQIKPNYAAAYCNLGIALANQGKLDDAIRDFQRTLQLNPKYVKAEYNLGLALTNQRKPAEAIQHYERALQLEPDFVAAHFNLGNVLAAERKFDEAIQQYERALQIKPDYAAAQGNWGNALVAQRKLDAAIPHFERALQLKPDDMAAHYNLGIALAAQGKLDEAIAHFQQALALATAQGNTALAETIRARLKSYQAALPQSQTP